MRTLASEIISSIAECLRAEANAFAEGTDEHNTFTDAADALDDAADLLEALNG